MAAPFSDNPPLLQNDGTPLVFAIRQTQLPSAERVVGVPVIMRSLQPSDARPFYIEPHSATLDSGHVVSIESIRLKCGSAVSQPLAPEVKNNVAKFQVKDPGFTTAFRLLTRGQKCPMVSVDIFLRRSPDGAEVRHQVRFLYRKDQGKSTAPKKRLGSKDGTLSPLPLPGCSPAPSQAFPMDEDTQSSNASENSHLRPCPGYTLAFDDFSDCLGCSPRTSPRNSPDSSGFIHTLPLPWSPPSDPACLSSPSWADLLPSSSWTSPSPVSSMLAAPSPPPVEASLSNPLPAQPAPPVPYLQQLLMGLEEAKVSVAALTALTKYSLHSLATADWATLRREVPRLQDWKVVFPRILSLRVKACLQSLSESSILELPSPVVDQLTALQLDQGPSSVPAVSFLQFEETRSILSEYVAIEPLDHVFVVRRRTDLDRLDSRTASPILLSSPEPERNYSSDATSPSDQSLSDTQHSPVDTLEIRVVPPPAPAPAPSPFQIATTKCSRHADGRRLFVARRDRQLVFRFEREAPPGQLRARLDETGAWFSVSPLVPDPSQYIIDADIEVAVKNELRSGLGEPMMNGASNCVKVWIDVNADGSWRPVDWVWMRCREAIGPNANSNSSLLDVSSARKRRRPSVAVLSGGHEPFSPDSVLPPSPLPDVHADVFTPTSFEFYPSPITLPDQPMLSSL